jgi:hypothetical protein
MKDNDKPRVRYDSGDGARWIEQIQTPFMRDINSALPSEKRAQLMTLAYLGEVAPLLQLPDAALAHLKKTIDDQSPSLEPGIRLRWAGTRKLHHDGSMSVWLRQTQSVRNFVGERDVFDVWEAGIRLTVHQNPLRILSCVSTVNDTIRLPREAEKPVFIAPTNAELLELVARHLNRSVRDFRDYRFSRSVWRLLRRVDAETEGETHRPVFAARIAQLDRNGLAMTFRAVFDHEGLYDYKELVADAAGMVFEQDPFSSDGLDAARPDTPSDNLDGYKKRVTLSGLKPVQNGKQKLDSQWLAMSDGMGNAPLAKQANIDFDFPSRSNEFAAVNAYYHCSSKLQLLDAFGFSVNDLFFSQNPSPIKVVTRSAIRPGCADGFCVNAQVVQGAQANTVGEIRFALADLSDRRAPLGLAVDNRFVWHEFCHALLVAATDNLEFAFAHSAGDAMAAIACDPSSKLAEMDTMRGVTFPWVDAPLRRHDRRAEDGWAWHGQMYNRAAYPDVTDRAGYRAEQILSSTLFRLYCAVGGDAKLPDGKPDVARRRLASDYVLYVLIATIVGLGDSAVPTASAELFAQAMQDSECGTNLFTFRGVHRPGGTIYKVIRWAFEKQGLYHPPGALWPHNGPGDPPDVDVYIDDGRAGNYDFTDEWQAKPSSLWLRAAADGGEDDQLIQRGAPNYVYLRVANCGLNAATVTATVYAQSGSGLQEWSPGAWKVLAPVAGSTLQAAVASGDTAVLGPFLWTPPAQGPVGLLAAINAPDDLANIQVAGLPCASQPVLLSDLVPNDNNLGFRRWA